MLDRKTKITPIGKRQLAQVRDLQKPLRMSHPVGQQPDWHPS